MTDNDKIYSIKDAVQEIKKTSKTKFPATIEVHCNLALDVSKADQTVRFNTTLPHGTGKTAKVAVFASKKVANADIELSESDLKKIEKGDLKPGDDFDVIVSEPKYMGKLASIARIIGPMGLMPNPKAGTVTEDVEKAVEQIKKGKMEIRTEQKAPIIHTIIGNTEFKNEQLVENFKEFYKTLKQNKPQKAKPDWIRTCFLSGTMTPSFELDLFNLDG